VGRFDVLRRGYEFFAELQTKATADFYFTSIAEENARARRFLERGVAGMPRYEFVGTFVTLIIRVGRRSGRGDFETVSPLGTREAKAFGSSAFAEQFLAFLNAQNNGFQFAPAWSPQDLIALGQLGFRSSDV